jgi:hypothetical protein
MKTPTAFNWTPEMEAIWPREMRPTASGLLAIWEALSGAAVYAEAAPAPDADGWISWSGGECPVDPDTVVDVRYERRANTYRLTARKVGWGRPAPWEVSHYRVVTPPAPTDDWIPHKAGDKIPVPARLYVEVKTRRGDVSREQAGEAYWGECGDFTITHWRHLP